MLGGCGALCLSACRHVAVLQVRGVDFKLQPLKLESVRPFLLDTVALSDGDFMPEDRDEVERFLEDQVQWMQRQRSNTDAAL